jgi:hypothetical protein
VILSEYEDEHQHPGLKFSRAVFPFEVDGITYNPPFGDLSFSRQVPRPMIELEYDDEGPGWWAEAADSTSHDLD